MHYIHKIGMLAVFTFFVDPLQAHNHAAGGHSHHHHHRHSHHSDIEGFAGQQALRHAKDMARSLSITFASKALHAKTAIKNKYLNPEPEINLGFEPLHDGTFSSFLKTRAPLLSVQMACELLVASEYKKPLSDAGADRFLRSVDQELGHFALSSNLQDDKNEKSFIYFLSAGSRVLLGAFHQEMRAKYWKGECTALDAQKIVVAITASLVKEIVMIHLVTTMDLFLKDENPQSPQPPTNNEGSDNQKPYNDNNREKENQLPQVPTTEIKCPIPEPETTQPVMAAQPSEKSENAVGSVEQAGAESGGILQNLRTVVVDAALGLVETGREAARSTGRLASTLSSSEHIHKIGCGHQTSASAPILNFTSRGRSGNNLAAQQLFQSKQILEGEGPQVLSSKKSKITTPSRTSGASAEVSAAAVENSIDDNKYCHVPTPVPVQEASEASPWPIGLIIDASPTKDRAIQESRTFTENTKMRISPTTMCSSSVSSSSVAALSISNHYLDDNEVSSYDDSPQGATASEQGHQKTPVNFMTSLIADLQVEES